uniref:Uncharacterized protein n=1 Tax=uncultured marine virus TaxID=186617 RepID=A0A0F7L9J3_9VIRU|nr:hypothetical protein [uncultured marine virus]
MHQFILISPFPLGAFFYSYLCCPLFYLFWSLFFPNFCITHFLFCTIRKFISSMPFSYLFNSFQRKFKLFT